MSLGKPGETGDRLCIDGRQVVDSGPFYMRFITRGSVDGGEEATGIGELIRPDRVDLGRHRPLVRMRVHDVREGDNSMWLPLFTGPKRGRIRRLMRFAVDGLIN